MFNGRGIVSRRSERLSGSSARAASTQQGRGSVYAVGSGRAPAPFALTLVSDEDIVDCIAATTEGEQGCQKRPRSSTTATQVEPQTLIYRLFFRPDAATFSACSLALAVEMGKKKLINRRVPKE